MTRASRDRIQLRREGAVIVLMAVLLPALVMLLAYGINVAYMELARTELQVSVDAAVRAGGRTYVVSRSTSSAISVAQDAARRNKVAGKPLTLASGDFSFGVASRPSLSSRYSFTPSGGASNALTLTARRTVGSPDGPISMLLPGIFGTNRFQPIQRAMATQVELDVTLVVDRSGSMAYANNESSNSWSNPAAAPMGWQYGDAAPNPSRWRDASIAVTEFVNVLSQSVLQERLSLVTYSTDCVRDVALTTSYSQVQTAIGVHTANFQGGLTNIGGGIVTALDSLSNDANARPWATKVIVLLTDGIQTTGYDAISAAYDAEAAGVTIHTVTFSTEADTYAMQQVASITSGQHFHALVQADLVNAFQTIAKDLPTLIAK